MKTSEILNQYFERKKLLNKSYSLRALARDVGVSAPYVSSVLNGKKKLSLKRVADFVRVLDLDDIACLQLKKSLIDEGEENLETLSNIDFINEYKPLDKKNYTLLDRWYNVAILDLTTTKNFKSDAKWIAGRLGISKLEVEIAIDRMIKMNLLSNENGILKKTSKKLRLPTKNSQELVRNYHKQSLALAINELESSTTSECFEQRLITGLTVAVNKRKINAAKQRLNKAIYEIANELSSDNPAEVYQLSLQLFPLTKES